MLDSIVGKRQHSILDVYMFPNRPVQAVNDTASNADRWTLSAVGLPYAVHHPHAASFAEVAVHCPSILCRACPNPELLSELLRQREQAGGRKDGGCAEGRCRLFPAVAAVAVEDAYRLRCWRCERYAAALAFDLE